MCVEKSEIIARLQGSTSAKSSPAGPSVADFNKWTNTQIQVLLSSVNGIDSSAVDDTNRTASLNRLLANKSEDVLKKLQTVVGLPTSSLSALRSLASEHRVDISDCVEKEEVVKKLILVCLGTL